MTTEEELVSQWYEALYYERSLEVMALLAGHPSLLKVGWGPEASQFVWEEEPWSERTALHVGVRRGNAELVEQVLKLCKVVIRKHSTKKEKEEEDRRRRLTEEEKEREHARGRIRRRTGQLDLAESEEAQKNDNNIACPSQDNTTGEGDRQPAESTRSADAGESLSTSDGQPAEKTGPTDSSLGLQNAVPSISRSEPDEVDKSREIVRLAVAAWKRVVDHTGSANGGLGFRNAVSSVRRSKRDGDEKSREIARLAVAKWKRRVDDSSFVGELPKHEHTTFVEDFYSCRDGRYKLDATAMAMLYGNRKVILMLLYAREEALGEETSLPALDVTEESEEDRADRARLRGATERCVHEFSIAHSDGDSLRPLEWYKSDLDFNFLPWQEYLFHFLFLGGYGSRLADELARALWVAVRSCSDSTWRFLLLLHDGQGRTPLSCESWRTIEHVFFARDEIKMQEEVAKCAMAARDGAGRTAIHVALAKGDYASIRGILRIGGGVKKLAPLVCERWQHPIPLDVYDWTGRPLLVDRVASEQNHDNMRALDSYLYSDGRSGITIQASPLHSAILHKTLSKIPQEGEDSSNLFQDLGLDEVFRRDYDTTDRRGREREIRVALHGVELAALVGDADNAMCLPLGGYNKNSELHSSRTREESPWPALHIAANAGNYDMLKLIMDDPLCDPYIEDWNGNTALHHALNMVPGINFKPHLLDFVDCTQVRDWLNSEEEKKKEILDDDPLAERQGCINLLLQAGCDIFKTNNEKQPPYPQGKLSKNPAFLSWWYGRQAKEFDSAQSTLSSAANAISVTATLVATASYVGPLQPPMGIAGDPSQIQDANLWVRIFIFCDTMSFYLAIVAITLSLIPSIPVPQQQMKDEVQRTRWMVAMAVTLLFPSIIFVLTAFIASSFAVVSANPTSTGGSLTIITASIGGFFCLLTFILFSLRLLAFIFPKSKHVRKIYNATNWTVPF